MNGRSASEKGPADGIEPMHGAQRNRLTVLVKTQAIVTRFALAEFAAVIVERRLRALFEIGSQDDRSGARNFGTGAGCRVFRFRCGLEWPQTRARPQIDERRKEDNDNDHAVAAGETRRLMRPSSSRGRVLRVSPCLRGAHAFTQPRCLRGLSGAARSSINDSFATDRFAFGKLSIFGWSNFCKRNFHHVQKFRCRPERGEPHDGRVTISERRSYRAAKKRSSAAGGILKRAAQCRSDAFAQNTHRSIKAFLAAWNCRQRASRNSIQ